MMNCYDSRQMTHRMRQAMREFRERQDVADDGHDDGAGDGAGENAEETLEERSAALELENQELRETVGAQAKELEVLRRWVVELN